MWPKVSTEGMVKRVVRRGQLASGRPPLDPPSVVRLDDPLIRRKPCGLGLLACFPPQALRTHRREGRLGSQPALPQCGGNVVSMTSNAGDVACALPALVRGRPKVECKTLSNLDGRGSAFPRAARLPCRAFDSLSMACRRAEASGNFRCRASRVGEQSALTTLASAVSALP